MARTGADVLVEALAGQGVRRVFGMPGSHSTSIYDALKRAGSISTVLARNEQAGAFMADGEARVTGRPGVICTTAGPGATNALTGIAEAWADSTPMLLLAGQVNSDSLDRECGNYHEIDLEAIFRPVTKFCTTVRRSEQIGTAVACAFRAMTEGRPRPAALFLPQDIMRTNDPSRIETFAMAVTRAQAPPVDAIQRAAELLTNANRPIILVGGGALWSGAGDLLARLAASIHAPVVTTLNGKGLIDERSPWSFGHARSPRAQAVLPHADAMLAVGCRFTEVLTNWRRMPVPPRLIQIDIDPDQIGMNYPVTLGIVCDARVALSLLLDQLPATGHGPGWSGIWERARSAKPPRPEWFIEILREELPEDVPVFTDACEMAYRMHGDWPAYGPRRFFYPSNYITLGWAFPAAIGAAASLGDRPVVSVSGDGGFVETCQELATASRYSLRVIALIHNDATYGAIKNIQERVHQGRFIDVELKNPDFMALAAAFSIPGHRAGTPDQLRGALRLALENPGPTLIEVPDSWRFLRDIAVPASDPLPNSPSQTENHSGH